MDSLQSVPMLEFHDDTLQAIRKEVHLDKSGRMKEAIDVLEDWVKKQNHFVKKDFSRDFLERTIVSTKGSIERAKMRLDRYCTYKTIMPNFFTYMDVEKTNEDLGTLISHGHLPKMTPDNYRVYFFKLNSDDGDASLILKYFKYIFILSEYVKKYDYCNGFVLVMDYTDANIMSFVTKLNVIELRQALTILMEGYGMRIKGIHMITPSKMIDTLISIFKSVLSDKISNRIHVHKGVDTLNQHVPKDILPVEYGGKERPLKTLQEDWLKVIASKEYQQYLKEIFEAKTNESYRQNDKFNEEYVGMPGSFRSLSVD